VSLHHIIEHVVHRLRYRQVDPFVTRCDTMADLGCGQHYRFLKSHHDKAERCWGLDITVADGEDGNITLKKWDITGRLPFEREAIDQITILAVLEHIANPQDVLRECHRVMTSGGRIIITTPSKLGIKAHDIMRGSGSCRTSRKASASISPCPRAPSPRGPRRRASASKWHVSSRWD
jgi:ubiquinone/menaquinone biosynthesis C-methylase UbiE